MELITNRTPNAVYEYTDLNRVESAVAEIASMFQELGIAQNMEIKTDWDFPQNFSVESWPVQSQMVRYLSNVERIKALFPNSVRLPASMDSLTWTGANNIEKILQIAFDRISGIKKTYRYSGELFAGEE